MSGIARTGPDAAFSDAIRLRDNWTCRKCGKQYGGRHQGLHCAHIIHGRRATSTRYCADNAMALCFTCHKWIDENPFQGTEWLVKELGQGLIDLVHEKHRTLVKNNHITRKSVSAHYRAEYTRMQETGDRKLISWN